MSLVGIGCLHPGGAKGATAFLWSNPAGSRASLALRSGLYDEVDTRGPCRAQSAAPDSGVAQRGLAVALLVPATPDAHKAIVPLAANNPIAWKCAMSFVYNLISPEGPSEPDTDEYPCGMAADQVSVLQWRSPIGETGGKPGNRGETGAGDPGNRGETGGGNRGQTERYTRYLEQVARTTAFVVRVFSVAIITAAGGAYVWTVFVRMYATVVAQPSGVSATASVAVAVGTVVAHCPPHGGWRRHRVVMCAFV